MMRPIKFRAWDKYNKKMLLEAIKVERRTSANLGNPRDYTSIGIHLTNNIYELDWELMQYTGLKDKNDKGIYESDKVRTSLKTVMDVWLTNEGIVYWDNVHAGFYIEYNEESAIPISHQDEIEVIGNIYENPKEPTNEQD